MPDSTPREATKEQREAMELAILTFDNEQNWSLEKELDGTALAFRLAFKEGYLAALATPSNPSEGEVEAAAVALYHFDHVGKPPRWESKSESAKVFYIEQARAALTAAREARDGD